MYSENADLFDDDYYSIVIKIIGKIFKLVEYFIL